MSCWLKSKQDSYLYSFINKYAMARVDAIKDGVIKDTTPLLHTPTFV
ncbi:MAG: hypothetical protein VZR73_03110 [Acutalibacteraceae bacterium]|nr:hypothetical protein [Clostridia bacterium]MEE3403057.1 hypothetical protein [Acutalibacteraceae bacterium]